MEVDEVAMYAKTAGAAGSRNEYGTAMMSSGNLDGILYVKDGRLYYESGLGPLLCCRCFRRCWYLANIKEIKVVYKETVTQVTRRGHYFVISMDPGLKITVSDSYGNLYTLMFGVPDAENFSVKLREYIDSSSDLPPDTRTTRIKILRALEAFNNTQVSTTDVVG